MEVTTEPYIGSTACGFALGIDVGGTKTAAGLVDLATGQVSHFRKQPTPVEAGGGAVLQTAVTLGAAVLASAGADPGIGVGIGLCELVDLQGRPADALKIDWRELDIVGAFRAIGPVVIESDVRAAAVAEASWGAGAGFAEVLYMTLSTGISHTLVLDGKPMRGAHGNAILTGAPEIEVVASGPAIAAATGLSAERAVAAAIAQGGEGGSVVRGAAATVGATLACLVNALDPGVVVIGGGLGLNKDFRDMVTQSMRALVCTEVSRQIPVLAASLGPKGGVAGAGLVALKLADG